MGKKGKKQLVEVSCFNLKTKKEIKIELSDNDLVEGTVQLLKNKILEKNKNKNKKKVKEKKNEIYLCFASEEKFSAVEYFIDLDKGGLHEDILQDWIELPQAAAAADPHANNLENIIAKHQTPLYKLYPFHIKNENSGLPVNPTLKENKLQEVVANYNPPRETLLRENARFCAAFQSKTLKIYYCFYKKKTDSSDTTSDSGSKYASKYASNSASNSASKSASNSASKSASDSADAIELSMDQGIHFVIKMKIPWPLTYLYRCIQRFGLDGFQCQYLIKKKRQQSYEHCLDQKKSDFKFDLEDNLNKFIVINQEDEEATYMTQFFLYDQHILISSQSSSELKIDMTDYCAKIKQQLNHLFKTFLGFLSLVGYYEFFEFESLSDANVFNVTLTTTNNSFQHEMYNNFVLAYKQKTNSLKNDTESAAGYPVANKQAARYSAAEANDQAAEANDQAAEANDQAAEANDEAAEANDQGANDHMKMDNLVDYLLEKMQQEDQKDQNDQKGGAKQKNVFKPFASTLMKLLKDGSQSIGFLPTQIKYMFEYDNIYRYKLKDSVAASVHADKINVFLFFACSENGPIQKIDQAQDAQPQDDQAQDNLTILNSFLADPVVKTWLDTHFQTLKIAAELPQKKEDFVNYLEEHANTINYTHLWQLVALRYNLCIIELEEQKTNVNIVCPAYPYTINDDLPFLIFLKWINKKAPVDDQYYEVLCYHAVSDKNDMKNIKFYFPPLKDHFYEHMPQVKSFLEFTLPGKYNECNKEVDINVLIRTLPHKKSITLLLSSQSDPSKYVGVLHDNFFIACKKSKLLTQEPPMKSKPFNTQDVSKELDATLQNLKKIDLGCCKPKYIIVNIDNNIVGVETEKGYFIPVTPEKFKKAVFYGTTKLEQKNILAKNFVDKDGEEYKLEAAAAAAADAGEVEAAAADTTANLLEENYILFRNTVATLLWDIQHRVLREKIIGIVQEKAKKTEKKIKELTKLLRAFDNVVFKFQVKNVQEDEFFQYLSQLRKKQTLLLDTHTQHQKLVASEEILVECVGYRVDQVEATFFAKLANELLRHKNNTILHSFPLNEPDYC